MSYKDTQARAHASLWWNGVEILVTDRENGKPRQAVIEWKPIDEMGIQLDPTVRLTNDAAQVLMDDLWNSGIRPTEGAGSAGAMRAAERHIEDLRKIAFKVIGVDKP